MDADPAPPRDVAHDRIVRQRLAALRHLREQIADAADAHIPRALPAPLRMPRYGPGRHRQVGLKRPGELRHAHVSAPQRGQEVLELRGIEPLRDGIARRWLHPQPLQLPVPDLLSVGHVALSVLVLEPVPHLGARAGAAEVSEVRIEPVAAWARLPGGEHFDPIAGADGVRQRHDAAVDLRPPAPMTDLGVDLIGEIERRRAGRKIDDVTRAG